MPLFPRVAARSNRARVEADRATGECAQLKEKLETARGEFTARINEYMPHVGELERGASVLSVDPNSEHVLRPSQLSQAAQAMAKDLHRAAAAQPEALPPSPGAAARLGSAPSPLDLFSL